MDLRAILMGLAFAFMWSSAFTSARMIVADAPPIAALSLRFLISGFIGVGIALALGQSWRLTPAQWRATVIFGICQNALYLGLNFVAMQTVEASLAAIIASTLPLLVAVAAWGVFGERLRPLAIAGLLAGFAGAALIMGSRLGGGVDLWGLVLCVLGVMALTLATLSVRGATSGEPIRPPAVAAFWPRCRSRWSRQDAGHHRLAHGHGADADAGVVAALGDDGGLLARPV
jgi:probable blue pigment (indigoidine) exporter